MAGNKISLRSHYSAPYTWPGNLGKILLFQLNTTVKILVGEITATEYTNRNILMVACHE